MKSMACMQVLAVCGISCMSYFAGRMSSEGGPLSFVSFPRSLFTGCYCEDELKEVRAAAHQAARHLAAAFRYARSGKTMLELHQAFLHIIRVINAVNNATEMGQNALTYPVVRPREVCPEIWGGMLAGYPFYYKGYSIDPNCTYGVPLQSILTIVLSAIDQTHESIYRTLTGIEKYYPHSVVLMATSKRNESAVRDLVKRIANVTVTVVPSERTLSLEYHDLLALVKTKYVLIGRNMTYFDENTRLERLVRMIDYLDVDVVGGAHRNWSGYWNLGCYQMKMLNYAFRLVEGYDVSYNSCIYCDYLTSPFVVKTKIVKELLSSTLTDEMLFLDLFAQLQNKNSVVMNCPDALFYTNHHASLEKLPQSDWLPLANQWKLLSVTLPEGKRLQFTCTEVSVGCGCGKGLVCSPCCLNELQDMLKYLFIQCDKHDIGCEIEAGSLVGALKMSGAVLWEKDADLNYRAQNQTAISKLIPEFAQAGYKLSEDTKCAPADWSKGINCGYFALRSKNWRIEMWGSTALASDILLPAGVPFLKIKFAGQWMLGYPNPGLFARNLYGDDTFKHVEHWLDQGYSTGWVPYHSGAWLKCSKPGFHACLDRYLPMGNLQFRDVWL